MDIQTWLAVAGLIFGTGSTILAGVLAWGRWQGKHHQLQEGTSGDVDQLKQEISDLKERLTTLSAVEAKLDNLRRDVERHERYFESLIPRELEKGYPFRLQQDSSEEEQNDSSH